MCSIPTTTVVDPRWRTRLQCQGQEPTSLREVIMIYPRHLNRIRLFLGLILLTLACTAWYQTYINKVISPRIQHAIEHNVEEVSTDFVHSLTTSESIDKWLEAINEDLFTNHAVQDNKLEQLNIDDIIKIQLKSKGLESVNLHEFKSIYIREPRIYSSDLTPMASGTRRRKIISCFNCPRWYNRLDPTTSYNRNFKACPYNECYFDHSGDMHMDATLVLFFSSRYPPKMPPRPPGQIWMNAKWEPTPYYVIRSSQDYESFRHAFNWTVGYSKDDDLFWPFNLLGWREQGTLLSHKHYIKLAKSMTKTAAYWPNRCDAQSNRDNYVKELQKYVDVDVYGNCGNHSCKSWTDCAPLANGSYKFYLAFENSFCKDYITDEFFKNFYSRRFIVPVVRGGFEYEKYFPPKTFINANNYKNAKKLGLYLRQLAKDIPRYAEFLREKDKLVSLNFKNDWCDLCETLHTDVIKKNVPDIHALTLAEDLCWTKDDIL